MFKRRINLNDLSDMNNPTEQGRCLPGKFRQWLTGSDRGILSAGAEHVLPAPVALGMLLIFKELTDTSGG